MANLTWCVAFSLYVACSHSESASVVSEDADLGEPPDAADITSREGGLDEGGRTGAAPPKDGATGDAGPASTSQTAAPTLIGEVQFSLPSQTFRGELRVGMSTQQPGAEIHYTTDGKLPSSASQLFTGELTLTSTTQLRAQAFVQGTAVGRPSTALYIARSFDASSDLPIVIVDGYGAGKPSDKKVYKQAALMVFEPVAGTASLAALPTLATRAGYHVRGQSSQRAPQTPYRLELWNNADEDEDYPLLGMPADSDWALIPPYYDRALVRNPLVYELGRELGASNTRARAT